MSSHKDFNTPFLTENRWFESKLKYLIVWIGFLYSNVSNEFRMQRNVLNHVSKCHLHKSIRLMASSLLWICFSLRIISWRCLLAQNIYKASFLFEYTVYQKPNKHGKNKKYIMSNIIWGYINLFKESTLGGIMESAFLPQLKFLNSKWKVLENKMYSIINV